MLKMLAMLTAVSALMAVGVSGQPNKAKDQNREPSNEKQAFAATAYSYSANCCTTQTAAKPGDDPFQWHAAIKRPEWWAIGIALGTLVIVLCQTIYTKNAAAAALLNATAVINAERAWIAVKPGVISPEFFPLRESTAPIPDSLVDVIPIAHQFPATLTNYGQTPARIEAVAIHYVRTPHHPSAWKPEPDYGDLVESGSFVFPKDEEVSAIVATLTPDSTMTALQIEEVRNAKQFLFAYGVVRYRDVYGKLHETRFGHAYKAQERHFVLKDGKIEEIRTGKARFETGGIPPAYNQAT